jgi:hypothetical protein
VSVLKLFPPNSPSVLRFAGCEEVYLDTAGGKLIARRPELNMVRPSLSNFVIASWPSARLDTRTLS